MEDKHVFIPKYVYIINICFIAFVQLCLILKFSRFFTGVNGFFIAIGTYLSVLGLAWLVLWGYLRFKGGNSVSSEKSEYFSKIHSFWSTELTLLFLVFMFYRNSYQTMIFMFIMFTADHYLLGNLGAKLFRKKGAASIGWTAGTIGGIPLIFYIAHLVSNIPVLSRTFHIAL